MAARTRSLATGNTVGAVDEEYLHGRSRGICVWRTSRGRSSVTSALRNLRLSSGGRHQVVEDLAERRDEERQVSMLIKEAGLRASDVRGEPLVVFERNESS